MDDRVPDTLHRATDVGNVYGRTGTKLDTRLGIDRVVARTLGSVYCDEMDWQALTDSIDQVVEKVLDRLNHEPGLTIIGSNPIWIEEHKHPIMSVIFCMHGGDHVVHIGPFDETLKRLTTALEFENDCADDIFFGLDRLLERARENNNARN